MVIKLSRTLKPPMLDPNTKIFPIEWKIWKMIMWFIFGMGSLAGGIFGFILGTRF